jgi:hypothetical protein
MIPRYEDMSAVDVNKKEWSEVVDCLEGRYDFIELEQILNITS